MSICLSMIVRDERNVMRRVLDSVRPLIDHWTIVDTGSRDGTPEDIPFHIRGIPGELHERPWVDFATNRTEALELARPMADYSLVIDADDTLIVPPGYQLPELTADSYTVDMSFGNLRYRRPFLLRNSIAWRYRGVVHEFLEGPGAATTGHLDGLTVQCGNDGARRQDPDKYRKDAAVLEAALLTETDDFLKSRYRFYLAQSYRDAGESAKAVKNYTWRADLGFWAQEIFVSWLNVGRLAQGLKWTDGTILAAFQSASAAVPYRAEALHGAACFLRLKQRYEEAYGMARRGLGLVMPADGLFVEPWIYEWGLLDEYSILAFWAGHYRQSLDACELLLNEGLLPVEHRARVIQNSNFARRKLLAP